MNILITGGCGFIGANLAIYFKQYGHHVTCFDNLSRRGSEIILKRILEYQCHFVHGDIRNTDDFDKLAQQYDIMFECSAEPSVLVGSKGSEAYSLINNNLIGFINCLEYCRNNQLSMIFFSTSRVYPYNRIESLAFAELDTRFEIAQNDDNVSIHGVNTRFPLEGVRSLYGATKLAAEYLLQEYAYNYDIPAIINRLGVIAGPWQLGKVDQGVFTHWMIQHYYGQELKYIGYGGKGKQVRDVLHIDDLMNLISKQVDRIQRYRAEIFNAGGSSFSSLSLCEATEICREMTGNKVAIHPVLNKRPADLIWYKTDNKDTISEFGWKPVKNARFIMGDIYDWLNNYEYLFHNTL